MAHQTRTLFYVDFEDLSDRITRFFKRTSLHIADCAENIGSSGAASELASLGRYDAARDVLQNYRRSSTLRQRLMQQLRQEQQ